LLTDSYLDLIDLPTGTTSWRWTVADEAYRLVSLAAAGDFSRFLCSSNNSADRPEVRDSRGKVYLLGADGQLGWEYELSYLDRGVGRPAVQFDSRTALFSIISAEKLELFAF
ncbi:MAG: hypothetical protein ABIJ61_14170, partial [bacterium]